MKRNPIILLIFQSLTALTASSQHDKSALEKEIYFSNPGLKTKTVQIRNHFRNISGHYVGCGFFIYAKHDYYLVANYHLVPGRAFSDTTLSAVDGKTVVDGGLFPEKFDIIYHTKKYDQSVDSLYDFFDAEGKPLFVSIPPDTEKLTPFEPEITDLIFYKIRPPAGAVVDTVNIFNLEEKGSIVNNALLSIWGFRGSHSLDGQYPDYVDTALSLRDRRQPLKNKFLFFHIDRDLGGDSGGPTYVSRDGHWTFAGMHCTTLRQSEFDKCKIETIKNYGTDVGVFLSAFYIKSAFNKFVLHPRLHGR